VIPFLRRPSLLTIVWIVVGVAIAASKHYFEDLNTAKQILSAVLAVLLWPLLLLGIDLHVK
jgi:ABC-type anion transport system duplicated permease subunit